MNNEQKKQYLEKYYQEKQKGVKFWPDIIYKDLLVAFAVFLILVMLATFVGVAGEAKADPIDGTYIPRPEWYFLWLFEFLKYIPGELEWVGATVIPGLLVGLLFLLPFFDRNPSRYWKRRPVAISVMTFIVLAIVVLTISATLNTPEQAEAGVIAGTLPEKIAGGEELYGTYCVECHGVDGDVKVIEGVEGLEGAVVSPISGRDVMYAFTDETLINIINMGQQDLGMPPFGKAYGGELGPGEIENIATYMRYTWDDRVEPPEETAQTGKIPALAEGETPSWEKHIQPLFKRYCGSCHRPGKKNNNYLIQSYEEAISSGDHAPNLTAGDLASNLTRMVHREDLGDIGGVMPPSKPLPEDLVKMIDLWVLAGMPNTAADAAGSAAPVVSAPTPVLTETVSVTATPAQVEAKPLSVPTATPTPTSPEDTPTATVESPTSTLTAEAPSETPVATEPYPPAPDSSSTPETDPSPYPYPTP